MKKLLKPYRHLAALFAVIVMAFAIFEIAIHAGATFSQAISAPLAVVGLWQLSQFALSRPRRRMFFIAGLTPEQTEEFADLMRELSVQFPDFQKLPERMKTLERSNDELRGQLSKLRKSVFGSQTGVRWVGNKPFVTDDCAAALTAVFTLDVAKLKNGLESMVPDASARERIIAHAAQILGVETRTALTTTEIPVPTIYVPQIIELVFAYGQARQWATVFPLGAGTVKLPRLKAGEDDFAFLGVGTAGMSQSVPEKKVTAENVTFTANKFGGLIRIPYELEEDTFIPLGQFLARYIARQLAKGEDKTLFLGDGTATYANCTGVGPYCASGGGTYLQQLAAGKTKPTDATINDFRAMRGLVNPAVLANMAANGQTAAAYYLNPTMEALLVTFNTIGSPLIYRPQQGNQPATLDGFPIRWIGVSQAYSTKAAASAYLAFFGDLSYWYLGERGAVRVEVSKEVWFATDEIAMRALERIDVECLGIDAMSALQTAAA